MGFSRQKYWSGLPFPSPVDHVLQNSPPWHVHLGWPLHRRAHSFTELDKAVVHVIRLASFLWLWFSVCLPSDGEGQEAYGSFLMGETEGLVLMGRAILSKFLIQFSVDGWGCVPSLLFDLRPNYGGDNEDNEDNFLQKVPWALMYSVPPTLQQATTFPCLRQRLLDTHGQVWVSLLWGHCSFLQGPGAHKVLFVPSQSLFPQSCVSSGGSTMG